MRHDVTLLGHIFPIILHNINRFFHWFEFCRWISFIFLNCLHSCVWFSWMKAPKAVIFQDCFRPQVHSFFVELGIWRRLQQLNWLNFVWTSFFLEIWKLLCWWMRKDCFLLFLPWCDLNASSLFFVIRMWAYWLVRWIFV